MKKKYTVKLDVIFVSCFSLEDRKRKMKNESVKSTENEELEESGTSMAMDVYRWFALTDFSYLACRLVLHLLYLPQDLRFPVGYCLGLLVGERRWQCA